MRRRYIISGRVQGVGFRQFVAERARLIKLAGWVRNLPDGRVEAEAEGDEAQLREFTAALAKGPPLARVDKVDESSAAASDVLPQPFAVSR